MKAGIQVYIDSIGYDEFEQKVFCKYGNSTSQTYTYSTTLRRLSNLDSKDHSGNNMYNLSYTFDKIGNVDSIHNSAGIINEMGGSYYHKYTYDNFNRISTAHGSWTGDPMNTLGNKASNYTLEMAYENMHRITTKQQEHTRDASNVGENTYDNLFKYEDVNHPNAVTSIENQSNSEVEEFNYDANGNVLLHQFDNGDTKNMLWDEANMLKAIKISNAASFQHYIYDANGERTLKGLGQYPLAALNGLSLTAATIGNYSQYVSGYMVMGPHYMVTNHYYSGTERIACKLVGSVDSSVDNSLELSGTEKAGLPDRQAEDLELVRIEFGFDTLVIEDTDPEEDDCEGNNDCPNVLYFFHPDHIGSSTFLTDEAGNPYQFILHLPFGESMAEQKAGGYSTKYRFTGKEVDEETGLYYFGARYYDPRISLWYGVDPLSEKTPSWNPYRYGFNNPIRIIDPTGMGEEEAKFPPKNFTGNSWCDSDGCFNRTDKNQDYRWTDNEGKDKGVYSSMTPEVKENRSWNNKLVSATENFYGVKEQDLRGEGGKDAVLKIASKQASIILNVFSLGEGAAALQTASFVGKGIGLYGMANDANGLAADITGFNAIEYAVGKQGAQINTLINSISGFGSSFIKDPSGKSKFKPTIGNTGDAWDLYKTFK